MSACLQIIAKLGAALGPQAPALPPGPSGDLLWNLIRNLLYNLPQHLHRNLLHNLLHDLLPNLLRNLLPEPARKLAPETALALSPEPAPELAPEPCFEQGWQKVCSTLWVGFLSLITPDKSLGLGKL